MMTCLLAEVDFYKPSMDMHTLFYFGHFSIVRSRTMSVAYVQLFGISFKHSKSYLFYAQVI